MFGYRVANPDNQPAVFLWAIGALVFGGLAVSELLDVGFYEASNLEQAASNAKLFGGSPSRWRRSVRTCSATGLALLRDGHAIGSK